MAEPLLRFDRASVGYPEREVLRDVSLDVHAGQIIALVGPNGAGKSTLLKSALGALPLLSGRLLLAGAEIHTLETREIARRCAYIAQEDSIAFDFTARDVVMMGRMPQHNGLIETADDHIAVDQAMLRADCLEFARRPISQLSGGERQRVLLARAVAQESPLLLLDEPNAHLDPGHSLAMERLLVELSAEGRAVLAAVHDLNMALRLGGNCALVHEGRLGPIAPLRHLVQSGSLNAAYGAPLTWHETDSGPLVAIASSVQPGRG